MTIVFVMSIRRCTNHHRAKVLDQSATFRPGFNTGIKIALIRTVTATRQIENGRYSKMTTTGMSPRKLGAYRAPACRAMNDSPKSTRAAHTGIALCQGLIVPDSKLCREGHLEAAT